MVSLPDHLPAVATARLPVSYEKAKTALADCARLDECIEWADKAEAIASYARQAHDDTLRKTADRIQARAIQRCGELLKQIERPQQGGRPAKNGAGAHPVSRAQAAQGAGLSRHQKRTALRVANVPRDIFESLVESDEPPSVTQLAERGTARPLVDLKGRDPKDYAAATQALGLIRRFADFAKATAPVVVARGSAKREHRALVSQCDVIAAWIRRLRREIR